MDSLTILAGVVLGLLPTISAAPAGRDCSHWAVLPGIEIGSPLLDITTAYPGGRTYTDDRGDLWYKVGVRAPFKELPVRSSSVHFWFDKERTLRYFFVKLKGSVPIPDMVGYRERRLGKANILGHASIRTWWGGRGSEYSVGWDRGCGFSVHVTHGRFGKAASVWVTRESQPPEEGATTPTGPANYRLKPPAGGRSAAGATARTPAAGYAGR